MTLQTLVLICFGVSDAGMLAAVYFSVAALRKHYNNSLADAVSVLQTHVVTTANNLRTALRGSTPNMQAVGICTKCHSSVVKYFYNKTGKLVCANCDREGYAAYLREV